MRCRPLAVLSALALGGCGGASTPSATACPTPTPDPPAPTAVAGPLSAAASRERVAAAGESVTFTVTVRGPASLDAPCAGPLRLVVIDRAGLHVFGAQPAQTPGKPCGGLRLAAGQAADFSVGWEPDLTLPPGPYDALLTLGDQPPITLAVLLGPPPACR